MLYGGEVCRRVIGPDATLVVTKHHVHDPVQAVFDGPVAAYDVPQVNRRHRHRSDIVACFTLDFSADFAAALDDDQAFEARPTMALLKPLDVVNDGRGSGLDAAMVAITTVVSRLISVSTNPLAFCSVTNSSASSRSEPWLPFSARTKSAFLSMTICAMSRWQPMASIVRIAPSIASISISLGIALTSLDFSATLT